VTCERRSRISITGYQPAIFTQSELWVTFAVVLTNGALVLVEDNRRAFLVGSFCPRQDWVSRCLRLLLEWPPPFA
jgi:hypothetical protein